MRLTKERVYDLMRKMCQLGQQLPQGTDDEIRELFRDPRVRAEAKLICAEMQRIEAKLLGRPPPGAN